jgi:hypothetical protein
LRERATAAWKVSSNAAFWLGPMSGISKIGYKELLASGVVSTNNVISINSNEQKAILL